MAHRGTAEGSNLLGTRDALVQIRDLCVQFQTPMGLVTVLNGVDLEIAQGEVVGLVGETGSGKTLTALSIPNLLPRPAARVARGTVRVAGRNVLNMPERQLRQLRGHEVAMVFQEPGRSLNPVFTIGEQLTDAVLVNQSAGYYPFLNPVARLLPRLRSRRAAATDTARRLLREVELPDPDRVLNAYPHELSLGMRQRCMIAIALSGDPRVLIADEPTTALDVLIEAQVIRLMRRLVRERNLAVLIISHNLGVVARLCDRVAVIYAGSIVETGPVDRVLAEPKHPYSIGLMDAVPTRSAARGALRGIPGTVPSFFSLPSGCPFHPRCPSAMAHCAGSRPRLMQIESLRQAACYLFEDNSSAQ